MCLRILLISFYLHITVQSSSMTCPYRLFHVCMLLRGTFLCYFILFCSLVQNLLYVIHINTYLCVFIQVCNVFLLLFYFIFYSANVSLAFYEFFILCCFSSLHTQTIVAGFVAFARLDYYYYYIQMWCARATIHNCENYIQYTTIFLYFIFFQVYI